MREEWDGLGWISGGLVFTSLIVFVLGDFPSPIVFAPLLLRMFSSSLFALPNDLFDWSRAASLEMRLCFSEQKWKQGHAALHCLLMAKRPWDQALLGTTLKGA